MIVTLTTPDGFNVPFALSSEDAGKLALSLVDSRSAAYFNTVKPCFSKNGRAAGDFR